MACVQLPSTFAFRLSVNLVCEMTERMMFVRQLHERWKLSSTNVFGPLTPRRERTPRRQTSRIRRRSRNLIETSLLGQRVRHRTQEPARVRIARSREKLAGRRLLKHVAGVHD